MRAALLGVSMLATGGCHSTLSLAELPEEPLALLYRPPQESRERADALRARDPDVQRGVRSRRKGGVAMVDELRRQATSLLGGGSGDGRKHAGRMALLDVRSGDVTLVEGARRGATPLDWSPDHTRLLFTQLEGEYLQLFEYDHAQGTVRTVSRGPTVHPRGCYGPDGRIVMMTVGSEGGEIATRIVISRLRGAPPERISERIREHSPACAPDARSIVWVSSPERGQPQLWVRSPALTGTPRRLSPGRFPSYSPDGQWIVYSAPVAGGWKLWRIRPDGTGRAPVGNGALEELHPSVAPDGLHVVYAVEDGFSPRLHVRRLDGSGDRILFHDGDGDRPVW
jgi:Tol biopolymer transport system component